MTNEELVALIQVGERDRLEELWRNVERFVWQQAYRQGADGVTVEDLYQSGYLALVEAADSYDAGRGMSFIGWLAMALKNAFSAAAGRRSERHRRDPLHQASSIDAIIPDSDGLTVGDGLEDPGAAAAFDSTDFGVFFGQCQGVVASALDTLPDEYAELLRRYYLQQRSIDEAAAAAAGYSSRATAYDAIGRALYRLAHGPYTRLLRECLDTFEEFGEYNIAARSTGIGSFQRTGMSATEAGALR